MIILFLYKLQNKMVVKHITHVTELNKLVIKILHKYGFYHR